MGQTLSDTCSNLVGTLGGIGYVAGEAMQIHADYKERLKHIRYEGNNPFELIMREYTKFAANHKIDYTWTVGHLSDIGFAAMATYIAIKMVQSSKNKLAKAATIISPTVWLTLHEILHGGNDMDDILCYIGGSAAAIVASTAPRLLKRSKGSLENCVQN